jgi:nitrate reductase NapE component
MLLALLMCYAGFTALCLSTDRHHGELLHSRPSPRRRIVLRVIGWLLLTVSIWPAVAVAGWGLGVVEWCAVLMLSALLLVLLLPYRPRLALLLAGVGLLASPVAAFAVF